MWTHYADNYQGICIGYRPRALLKSLPPDAKLVRLGYGPLAPELGKHDGTAPAQEAALKILSHKKSTWLYEREWRIFEPLGKVHFSNDCIAEIRLGLRIPSNIKNILTTRLSDKIRIYQMTVENYQHHWKRLNHADNLTSNS